MSLGADPRASRSRPSPGLLLLLGLLLLPAVVARVIRENRSHTGRARGRRGEMPGTPGAGAESLAADDTGGGCVLLSTY